MTRARADRARNTRNAVCKPKASEPLAPLTKEELKADPFSGVIWVFRAKRADRLKLVFWDGSGLVLVSKRLDDGKFRWPRIEDGVVRLTPAQFTTLVEGLDWTRVFARRVRQPAETS